MKLQNLIYATMVACAFSACSNDDDPNIPDPALELDATFTTAFSAVGNSGSSLKSVTKADDLNNVSKIGLAVFDATSGNLTGYLERNNGDKADTTACIAAKSGSVKVLVIANPITGMFNGITTLDGFLDKTSSAEINTESLLMTSKVYNLTLKVGRNVMVKDLASSAFNGKATQDQVVEFANIKVYRNVARIEVPSITVKPRDGFGKGKGATFTLKKVFVANVCSEVRVGGLNGVSGLFGAEQDWCSVVSKTSSLKLASETESDGVYSKKFNEAIIYTNEENGVKKTIDDTQFFVYDNASATVIGAPESKATLLVLKGDYSYITDAGEIKVIDHYWTVAINNSLTDTADKDFLPHCGVLRNVKYVMNVTITGSGQETIDPNSDAASLTANVEVVPWGQVVLDPSID